MEYVATVPRRAGRPLSFDRSAALKKAMLAFWQHGYETTSIVDLTAAMGITAPSLYTAFGDKKQLFLEAVELYAGDPTELAGAIDRALSAREAAAEMLNSAAEAFTGDATPRGCLLASATASGSSESADVQLAVANIRRRVMNVLASRIERDVAAGLLPAETDAAAVAGMVMAVTQGMSVLARDGASRETLRAIAETALAGWPSRSKGSMRSKPAPG